MKRIVLPFLLALTFYAESLFADFFPPEIMAFGGERLFVPHFILVNLAIMGIYYFRNYALIYAAIMGLLFDVYYTELIGVYLFLFPITVYIASKISKFLQANFFVAAVITLLNVAIVEVLVYILNVLVLQVKMAPSVFYSLRLWPTLALNLLFFIIVFFPFSRWLLRRKKEVLEE